MLDITKLSEQELKALGFDLVTQINNAQQSLQMVQIELQKRVEEEKPKK